MAAVHQPDGSYTLVMEVIFPFRKTLYLSNPSLLSLILCVLPESATGGAAGGAAGEGLEEDWGGAERSTTASPEEREG